MDRSSIGTTEYSTFRINEHGSYDRPPHATRLSHNDLYREQSGPSRLVETKLPSLFLSWTNYKIEARHGNVSTVSDSLF